MKDVQLKRRDAAQIAYHWVNAVAIVSLTVTGLAISFGYTNTADLFLWHLWGAWVFLAALVFHIWYSTVRFKHFHRMWASLEDIAGAMKRLPGANAEPAPKHGFYKVEQIALHWAFAGVLLVVVITGFILWKPGRDFVGPFWMPWGWDAVFLARTIHQIFTFILIAFVIAHVYFAVLVPKEWPLLKSIFTGKVPYAWYAKEHRVSAQMEAKAKAHESSQPGLGKVKKA